MILCAFCVENATTEVARENEHGLLLWPVCESHFALALTKGYEEV